LTHEATLTTWVRSLPPDTDDGEYTETTFSFWAPRQSAVPDLR